VWKKKRGGSKKFVEVGCGRKNGEGVARDRRGGKYGRFGKGRKLKQGAVKKKSKNKSDCTESHGRFKTARDLPPEGGLSGSTKTNALFETGSHVGKKNALSSNKGTPSIRKGKEKRIQLRR